MSQLEPNTPTGPTEPTAIAHTIQVVLAGLGVGQWAVLDNPTVSTILTVAWLVLAALVARKNRADVTPNSKVPGA